jgi:hypothetical protein
MGLIYGNLNAQTYQFLGSKLYGGTESEEGINLLKVSESKLLLVGLSNSDISGNKTTTRCTIPSLIYEDIWLVMVNTSFDILWQKSLGGNNEEFHPMAINAGNGQILASAISISDSSCTRNTQKKGVTDIMLYMLDSLGGIIWEKNIGGIDDCYGNKIAKLSDGNFILLTSTYSEIGNDKTSPSKGNRDIWLIKFDRNGNIIFDKTYGGNQFEQPRQLPNQLKLDFIESNANELVVFSNSNSSNSFDVSDTSHGGYDFWMFKIDSLGNKLTDFCYGGTNSEAFGTSSKSSNGYLLGGSTSSPQSGSISQPPLPPFHYSGWIISVDSSGNKIWDRRYESGAPSTVIGGNPLIAIQDIIPASNGEYWVTAFCNTLAGNDVTEPPYGKDDAWVFKMNSSGAIIWDKRFGSTSRARPVNSVLMADSSIFLFCYADTGITNVKSEHGYGRTDYYLVHFRYASTTPLSEIEIKQSQIQLYPNPTQDIVNVNYLDGALPDKLEMYDFQGKLLRSFNAQNNSIDVSHLSPSIYIIKFVYTEGAIFKKFVKQ